MNNTSDPILSIVVVTYNASRWLATTLDSLGSQNADRELFELILVDGQSTDDTVNKATKSALFDQMIIEPDRGIYDAMNKGAGTARGKWLHFLNAGDLFFDSTSLSTLIEFLEQNDRPWAVGGAINLGGGIAAPRRIPSLPHAWWRHAVGLQPHCHQATWVRRELFHAMGGHSLSHGTAGDFDLILRLGLISHPAMLDRTVIRYLGGGISDGAWRKNGEGQHSSRVDRMQLGRVGKRLDRCWVVLGQALSRARIGGGRMRSKFFRGRAK